MKKLFFLLLLLSLTSCSVFFGKKDEGNNGSGGDNFGNVDASRQANLPETTFQEPPPQNNGGNNTTNIPPTPACERIAINQAEIPDAQAGELIDVALDIRGNCGVLHCSILSGPEWLSMEACRLTGTPDSSASLGEQTISIRAQNENDPTDSADRTFNFSVQDDFHIHIFASRLNSNLNGSLIASSAESENPNDNLDLTLGEESLYLIIRGHAQTYTKRISDSRLSLNLLGSYLYKINLADGAMGTNQETLTLNNVSVTVDNGLGNTITQTFNVTFHKNPCDHPLQIQPIGIFKQENPAAHPSPQTQNGQNQIDVTLGQKYQILFEVIGAKGPYTWSFASAIEPTMDCTQHHELLGGLVEGPLGIDFKDKYEEKCRQHLLTTTTNYWHEVQPSNADWHFLAPSGFSSDDETNKTYYQLETTFSYPGKNLPWGIRDDGGIFDQLNLTVQTASCPNSAATSQQTTYTLNHNLKLPTKETLANVKCSQKVTDVWDTDSTSRVWIQFKKGDIIGGQVEIKPDTCDNDHSEAERKRDCEDPHPGVENSSQQVSIDEVNAVDITFGDKTENDFCPFWDCDYDEMDYDLISLECSTPFRTFIYYDGEGGSLNDDVVRSRYRDDGFFTRALETVYINSYSLTYDLDITSQPLNLPINKTHGVWSPKPQPDYPAPPASP